MKSVRFATITWESVMDSIEDIENNGCFIDFSGPISIGIIQGPAKYSFTYANNKVRGFFFNRREGVDVEIDPARLLLNLKGRR